MSETNTTDSNTYHQVNIDKYSQLKDEDNAGPFDLKSSLFTNANGDAKLTSGGANENNFEAFADWYDFDKKEFTNAGRAFYTKNMEGSSEEEKNAYLTQVENELKMALIDDYKKRKKTDPDAVQNDLTATSDIDSEDDEEKPQGASIKELEELINSNYRGLHSSDRFLQRLSLKTLKYPLDADYGNTQDYIQIDQFTYQAPNPEILFGGEDTIETFGNILKTGLSR